MTMTKNEKTQTAKLSYLHIAPRKVRLIANTLKGLSVQESEAQLLLRPQRSARPLLKLIRSAVANAKNKNMDAGKLVIASILVNQGPMLKRILPRAQGQATPIHKKMSHVVLVLKESDKALINRFTINPPIKKEKVNKKERTKPKSETITQEKPKEKAGLFRRLFRRTSV